MGLCLFFLLKCPAATFIQGAAFIPDSRVNKPGGNGGDLTSLGILQLTERLHLGSSYKWNWVIRKKIASVKKSEILDKEKDCIIM